MKNHFTIYGLIVFVCVAVIAVLPSYLKTPEEPTVSNLIYEGTNVELLYVHDGDTFIVNIPGWPPIIGERIPIRIYGIDAPELKEKEPALKAKTRLIELLNGPIELRRIKRDKYFRILAEVYVNGHSVASALLAEKLVKPYK